MIRLVLLPSFIILLITQASEIKKIHICFQTKSDFFGLFCFFEVFGVTMLNIFETIRLVFFLYFIILLITQACEIKTFDIFFQMRNDFLGNFFAF